MHSLATTKGAIIWTSLKNKNPIHNFPYTSSFDLGIKSWAISHCVCST